MTEYLDVLFLAVGYAVGWYVHRPRPYAAPMVPRRFRRPAVKAVSSTGQYRVMRGGVLVYSGSCGATARKHIEGERANAETGEFYDNDVRRDWWPR